MCIHIYLCWWWANRDEEKKRRGEKRKRKNSFKSKSEHFFWIIFQKTKTERERKTPIIQKTAPHRKRSRCLRRRRCHPISSSRFLLVVSVAPTFVSPDRSWTRFVWTDARTSFFKLFLPGQWESFEAKTEIFLFLEDSRPRRSERVCACVRAYARACKEKTWTTFSAFEERAFEFWIARALSCVLRESLTSLPSRKKILKRERRDSKIWNLARANVQKLQKENNKRKKELLNGIIAIHALNHYIKLITLDKLRIIDYFFLSLPINYLSLLSSILIRRGRRCPTFGRRVRTKIGPPSWNLSADRRIRRGVFRRRWRRSK